MLGLAKAVQESLGRVSLQQELKVLILFGVFRKPGGKSGSPGDADGVEIKSAEMEVDGVAESLAVAE